MAKSFKSATAFKSALEARMRTRVQSTGLPLQTVQLKFVIERLLARLFRSPDAPWLLKGGFAFDLRYRPRARTTKDVDLSVTLTSSESSFDLRDRLQAAADLDLGDYLTFRIGELKAEFTNAPGGGGRFPCEAVMLGKVYARFHIDVGQGDAVLGDPEQLIGDDLLDFAGLEPAIVRAITTAQQFAEKIHAYTFPWNDRLNTRTKDLVDLVLQIERDPPPVDRLRTALIATFQTRKTHAIPTRLPPPPDHWKIDFPHMAEEAGLSMLDYLAAYEALDEFWRSHSLGGT
jgi:hypothetical protein